MATKNQLLELTKRINHALGPLPSGERLVLDHYAIGGGYQIDRGGHHLSPRMPAAQMERWLDGYAQAVEDAVRRRTPGM